MHDTLAMKRHSYKTKIEQPQQSIGIFINLQSQITEF